MNANVLVLAEQKDSEPDSITHELLYKGRELADAQGGQLIALIAGYNTGTLQEALAVTAADRVLALDDPALEQYNAEAYAEALGRVIKEEKPGITLCGYTYFGIEIGTAAASRADCELISNCVDLVLSDDGLVALRPVFGGTFMARLQLNRECSYVVSMEKGAQPKAAGTFDAAPVERPQVAVDTAVLRTQILEVIRQKAGEIDITQSNIIVSVGRGIGDKDKIQVVQDLADALGGVVACSRPVADMGWLPVQQQVGISANYVTPDVYIACGISGASQHVAAMRDSSTIIAINKDANAPIFRVAHYGIIGDLFDVIPALTEAAQS
jgi:electron transfer flavoprotein alpha subunit